MIQRSFSSPIKIYFIEIMKYFFLRELNDRCSHLIISAKITSEHLLTTLLTLQCPFFFRPMKKLGTLSFFYILYIFLLIFFYIFLYIFFLYICGLPARIFFCVLLYFVEMEPNLDKLQRSILQGTRRKWIYD